MTGYLGDDNFWKMTKVVKSQDSEEMEYFPEDEGFIKLITEAATQKNIKVKAPAVAVAKTLRKCE